MRRPVAAMAKEFPDGAYVAPHSHPRAQLLFAARGVMRLATPAEAWIVPPLRAVVIPAGTEHEIRMSGRVAMRTLYIAREAAPWLPERCAVIEVSPLLRELILVAVEEPVEYERGSRGELVMELILREVRAAASVPLHLPLPREPRLRALCAALLADPASPGTLDEWAARVGASSRTLVRLFRRETGLSFALWRQQLRLAEAVSQLACGRAVGLVAEELGYRSASAFAAMFRRALGTTPKRYLAPAGPPSRRD
ncbi:MAG TPA: helix-turn-helix transcriptional regulator [Stellaceae bacterium]|nr:helix-turn-helix transcriptional regulator [Stellaceae bacterium]